ncbi:hypothetical protein SK854_43185 [Lentzea sp. BCCO 10_0061]|uniref:HAF family extracellular repeat protein n=1 Tax=Lentzea sokolovensis TaxID=3095429 RepID=A0ABU4VB10_9PSEU|nr:hypothetical protein [Lentzea sp. BCCO 10_0061]MDX8148986.1 hypothetical protein [Lentzea sp. BCCO 10_0061]
MSRRLSFALSTALLATVVGTAPAHADTTIINLVGLPGGHSHRAMSINDSGLAVGSSIVRDVTRAVKFDGGRVTELVGPDGASVGLTAVNNHGAAVGTSTFPGVGGNAIRFDPDGKYSVLSTPFGYNYTRAAGIDDNGITYGVAARNDNSIPVSWRQNGALTAMKLPAGFTGGSVASASPNGYAAGFVYGPGQDWVPVRWNPDHSVTVLPLPAGGVRSRASAVNRNGDVVGTADLPGGGGPYGVRWNADGSMNMYGHMDEPTGVNDHGIAVGYGWADGQWRPFRWTREGEKLDLGLLSLAPSIEKLAINNDGVIVGSVWGTAYKWIVS